jgi:hypothetical protein
MTNSLPPPLPHETRTVGQLVAEAIRLYGRRFWLALPLGASVAVLEQVLIEFGNEVRLVLLATVGGALLSASYASASALASGTRLTGRTALVAIAAGTVAFVPFPLLVLGFVLPGLAWLAFVGLVVPVAVIERLGFRAAFGRATELARADYVHALGSLSTLVILYVLTRLVLVLLLRGSGDQTERVAIFLADFVISPLLFLGAALLYFDQAARVPGRRGSRRAKPGSAGP